MGITSNWRESGFTLVELMVAIAIIGLMVAIAIPNYTEWQMRSRLRQATEEVASQLMLARMKAMNQNRSVDVTIQDTGSYTRVSAVVSTTGVSVLDKNTDSYVFVVGNPITVSFSSMGFRTSAGTGIQTIGLCNTAKLQYSVSIIPAGKVNWQTAPTTTPCS
ncbi:MAG: GspH/FimT family pseudopilin [Nitrospira sp.]|nr:GspH/FimT family pseudopilin [Nitrospira sp.]